MDGLIEKSPPREKTDLRLPWRCLTDRGRPGRTVLADADGDYIAELWGPNGPERGRVIVAAMNHCATP